jgi:predicted transcriptional regulator
MADDQSTDITALTVQLLSAFVSNNSVPSENLAELIRSTRAALTGDDAAAPMAAPTETVTPAVSVRKSLSSPDHILSLIDGKPYKTLKRHLASHGMTPEDYRQRYQLPKSYPMVAQAYSAARRAVAEKLGLGKRTVANDKAAPDARPVMPPSPEPAIEAAPPSKVAKPRKTGRAASASARPPAAAPAPQSAAVPTAPVRKGRPRKDHAAGTTVPAAAPDAPAAKKGRKRLSIANATEAAEAKPANKAKGRSRKPATKPLGDGRQGDNEAKRSDKAEA